AFSGKRRMIESTVAVLPDPDSPTRPISFPGSTEKLTLSTARTSPASVKNDVHNDLTSSRAVTLSLQPTIALTGRTRWRRATMLRTDVPMDSFIAPAPGRAGRADGPRES